MPTAYGQPSRPPMYCIFSKIRPFLSHSPSSFTTPFRRRRSLAFSALPTKTKTIDAALMKEKWLESLTLASPEEEEVTREKTESSFVIGIDPDLSGALALLKTDHILGSTEAQDDSRRVASELFPSLSSQLKRKMDHGRAEALLIAAYGETHNPAKLLNIPQEFVSPEVYCLEN